MLFFQQTMTFCPCIFYKMEFFSRSGKIQIIYTIEIFFLSFHIKAVRL